MKFEDFISDKNVNTTQGCPEATAHGDIASYSAHLRRLLFCQIKEIFIHFK